MSRTLRIRPTGAAVIGAMIGAMALAGCGAGQITQTDTQASAVGGASAAAGTIAVRNAEIEYPDRTTYRDTYNSGESAPLRLTIVNTGGTDDRLVSASSPVAASVQVSGSSTIPAGIAVQVAGKPAPIITPSAGPTATPGATPTATAVPSAAPVATSSPASPVGEHKAQVVLTGLRDNLRAGLLYEVVLTFQNAGQVHVDVPIGNPAEARQVEHSQ